MFKNLKQLRETFEASDFKKTRVFIGRIDLGRALVVTKLSP